MKSIKKIGFIIDPIEKINTKKDSSFAMMLAMQKSNHEILYIKPEDIFLKKDKVCGNAYSIKVEDKPNNFFEVISDQEINLASLDSIFMRIDPPFNMNYIYLTYLLELVEKESERNNHKLVLINKPSSIRDCNEKLFTAWFPQCCPETLVTKSSDQIKKFLLEQKEIILKPLDGMGGESIFYLHEGCKNKNVILETITKKQTEYIMAQAYLPEAKLGDKRITLINGEPVSHAVLRTPPKDDIRGNIAVGGTTSIVPLTDRDRWLCAQVGPVLKAKGLYWVGLDIIGDYITEINVTSPTCIRELETYRQEEKEEDWGRENDSCATGIATGKPDSAGAVELLLSLLDSSGSDRTV